MPTTRNYAIVALLAATLTFGTGSARAAQPSDTTGSAGNGSPGAPGLGDPYLPMSGNGGYDVSHYDVTVGVDPSQPDHFTGDTTVKATATQNLSRFDLDLQGFSIDAVTVNGVPATRIAREGEHEVVITPADTIRQGARFDVRVRYSGAPVGKSWHKLVGGGIDVQGEPESATAWFPSNDHPSDKATFSLTAIVPDGWTVIGNGLPGPTTRGNGRTTFRWHEDHPMVTYASTMAIDKMTVHTSTLPDGTPIINAYGQNTQIIEDSEQVLPEIIQFLSSKFGPYPFESTGSIVVDPEPTDEDFLFVETQTRPTYASAFFDVSAVHELAHQWFGDNVSFTDWRDGCIAECFAQYAGQLWDEYKNGADPDESYRSIISDEKTDPEFWSVPLYDSGQELPEALYERGPLMLHALRRLLGDHIFFALLQDFQRTYRDGNASWPDFENFAQSHSGRDLTGFFHAWAHSTKIPAGPYLYPGTLKS